LIKYIPIIEAIIETPQRIKGSVIKVGFAVGVRSIAAIIVTT